MSKGKLRVAVIGGGMIANSAHIPAWQAQSGVELVGVTDNVVEAASATAKRHNIPGIYSDMEKMLVELKPDVVSVCTPAGCHKAQVVAALQAGAHVLCEKPLAIASADVEEMFRVAGKSKRHLLVGQSMRFYNQVSAAKEFAASGQLGEIYCADASRLRRRGVPTHGSFHVKALSGGGVLYDLGVHMLDLVLWIMGNPKVVAVSGMTYTKLANRNEGLITSAAESGAFARAAATRSRACSAN